MESQMQLGEVPADVVLKDIKNVHLSVHPPARRVWISAPIRMSLETIRGLAISKLDWIRRQQRKLREQERETPRDFVDRENHDVWAKRYPLSVLETERLPAVELDPCRIVLRLLRFQRVRGDGVRILCYSEEVYAWRLSPLGVWAAQAMNLSAYLAPIPWEENFAAGDTSSSWLNATLTSRGRKGKARRLHFAGLG